MIVFAKQSVVVLAHLLSADLNFTAATVGGSLPEDGTAVSLAGAALQGLMGASLKVLEKHMISTIPAMLLVGLLGMSAQALADDSPGAQPVLTHKQKMQACMAKQRASNSGITAKDMRKACEAELQTQENNPSKPATPNNVPPIK
jgi:hypothetical protein